MLLGEFHYAHAAAVSLLLDSAGRKDTVYDLISIRTDLLRPSSETVTVPFKVLLMIFGHVLPDR